MKMGVSLLCALSPCPFHWQNKSAGAKEDDDGDDEEENTTLLLNSMVVELENEMPAAHFKYVGIFLSF